MNLSRQQKRTLERKLNDKSHMTRQMSKIVKAGTIEQEQIENDRKHRQRTNSAYMVFGFVVIGMVALWLIFK